MKSILSWVVPAVFVGLVHSNVEADQKPWSGKLRPANSEMIGQRISNPMVLAWDNPEYKEYRFLGYYEKASGPGHSLELYAPKDFKCHGVVEVEGEMATIGCDNCDLGKYKGSYRDTQIYAKKIKCLN